MTQPQEPTPAMDAHQLREQIKQELDRLYNQAAAGNERDVERAVDKVMSLIALAHPDTNHVHDHPSRP